MKYLFLALLFVSMVSNAQKIDYKEIKTKIKTNQPLKASDFLLQKHTIYLATDSVILYTYHTPNSTPNSIWLDLQGTGADSLFPYEIDERGNIDIWAAHSWGSFERLPKNFMLVIVAKAGIPEISKQIFKPMIYPEEFIEKNALDDRVMRANEALKFAKKHLSQTPEKTVVWGYSEGFYVASKLSTINKDITHLGIGGGGGWNDFYDFLLFNSFATHSGSITKKEFKLQADTLLMGFKEVVAAPNDIENDGWEYTNKRWASYAEPPVLQLLQIDIPIFLAGCLYDESAPIESMYLIPLEFIRTGKTNLTFKIYPYGHSFTEKTAERTIYHYKETIQDFINFISNN